MNNVITSDELDLVSKVTTEACEKLGYDKGMKTLIGSRVLNFVNKGERRYDVLLAIALDKTSRP